jgi:dimethylargininase
MVSPARNRILFFSTYGFMTTGAIKNSFSRAIVRRPCPAMVHGITSAGLGKPVFELAVDQHHQYIQALEQCGLTVKILESDDRFPDSVFIEDVALCTPNCAVITNPGAPSRNGETDGMMEVLADFFQRIEEIASPGTLEGGDVMMVGSHYFIGLSERTNREGAEQLIEILIRHGMDGSWVPLNEVLHLKTGVSYLENNNLLVCGEFIEFSGFQQFNRIIVPSAESYAVNSLWINGTVLVPEGFPETRDKIEHAGYPVITLDVSEFRKLDGGLSCLSLRF